jgi:metallo-beta-lactamase class B
MTVTRHTAAVLGVALSLIMTLIVVASNAPPAPVQNDWTEPFPAFRIAGNLYYVGSKGLASYLIATPEGHILINSDLEANVPMIRASVESLGFKFNDIKILLISHAHYDHCAGSAAIKQLTGAKYMVMEGDVEVVESGGKNDFQYGNDPTSLYPPAKVDRVLHDGDQVKLGDATLTARLTPGHTKGCTTWTMRLVDVSSKLRDIVIVGSPNVNPGYKLVGNTVYPGIKEDYEKTFRVLKSLPVDYFLGAHGSYFDLESKYPRFKLGETVFFDPKGYKNYVDDRERAFRMELTKQRSDKLKAD